MAPNAPTNMVVGLIQDADEHVNARQLLVAYQRQEPKLRQEIVTLQHELSSTRVNMAMLEQQQQNAQHYDAERWSPKTSQIEYKYRQQQQQIAVLNKNVTEQQEIIEERDRAIERLVHHSWVVEESKGDELARLHHSNDEYAEEFLAQTEELQRCQRLLQVRDDQVLALQTQVSTLHATQQSSEATAKAARDQACFSLQAELARVRATLITTRERQVNNTQQHQKKKNDTKQKAELEELRDENETNRCELRDLRRQLWKAKEATGVAADLKHEHAQAKYQLDQWQATQKTSIETAKTEAKQEVRHQLEAAEANNQALEQRLAQLERFRTMEMEAMDTLQAKLQECSHAAMDGGAAAAKSAAIQTKLKGSRQELKSKTEALENSEVVRLRLEGQLAEAKAAYEKLDEENTDTIMRDVVVLLGNEEKEELLKQYTETLKTELGNAKQASDALEQSMVHTYERQRTALRTKHDAILENVRRDLTALRTQRSEDIAKLTQQVAALQQEKVNLAQDYAELQLKHKQVYALERTLHAREKMEDKLQECNHPVMRGGGGSEQQPMAKKMESLRQELKSKTEALENSEVVKLRLEGQLVEAKAAYEKLDEEATDTAMRDVVVPLGNEEKEELLKQYMETLKTELGNAKQASHASEQSMVLTYERQKTVLRTEHDAILKDVRMDLTALRTQRSKDIAELTQQVAALRQEKKNLAQDHDTELQLKHKHVYALEHTLHAQEKTVDSMRAEMDQLQSSMTEATNSRRAEVEELEQEVMATITKSTKQEREVIELKMLLEESKLEHNAEATKLKEFIAEMEKESPLAKAMVNLQNDQRMLMVRERLEQLKMRNEELQEQNLKLGGRLERAIIKIQSFDAEKKNAEDVERECVSLRKQVNELERILKRLQLSPKSVQARSPGSSRGRSAANNDDATVEDNAPPVNAHRKSPLRLSKSPLRQRPSAGKKSPSRQRPKADTFQNSRGLFERSTEASTPGGVTKLEDVKEYDFM
jgi:hypothetical protein